MRGGLFYGATLIRNMIDRYQFIKSAADNTQWNISNFQVVISKSSQVNNGEAKCCAIGISSIFSNSSKRDKYKIATREQARKYKINNWQSTETYFR